MRIEVPGRLMHTYKECFFDQGYLRKLKFFSVGKPNPVIVDIGANAGYFSLFMFSRFPGAKILAYEPVPANFRLLSKYQAQNPGLNFLIFPLAVGSESGSIRLNMDTSNDYTTAASVFSLNGSNESLEVRCTDLLKIFGDNSLGHIDFLKLDCEGSEYDILYSASHGVLSRISCIAMETHSGKSKEQNGESLANYLKQSGFEVATRPAKVWAWRKNTD